MFDEEWKDDSACRSSPLALFFPSPFILEIAQVTARQFCFDCPVKDRCLKYAKETEATDGIWGGYYFGKNRYRHQATDLLARYK